jgi:hypothetical protein
VKWTLYFTGKVFNGASIARRIKAWMLGSRKAMRLESNNAFSSPVKYAALLFYEKFNGAGRKRDTLIKLKS